MVETNWDMHHDIWNKAFAHTSTSRSMHLLLDLLNALEINLIFLVL